MNRDAKILSKVIADFVSSETPRKKKLKEKVFAKGELAEITSQFPPDWYIADLIDVTHLITCGVAKRPEYVETGIPFLSAQNARPFKANLNKIKYIEQEAFEKLTVGGKPEKNDVLYTRVGNCGEAAKVEFDFDFAIYVSLTLIKPYRNLLNTDFLVAFLNSQFGLSQAAQGAIGIGLKNLNVDNVRRYIIPLPPLAEQKIIADKLDSLLAQVETTKSRLDRVPEILKRFRQSVLAAAVSGRLTEEWRKKNSTSKQAVVVDIVEKERLNAWLYEQQKAANRKGVEFKKEATIRKYKKSASGYIDEFNLTAIEQVPDCWIKTNLDSVSIAVTGKTPKTTDETNWGGDIPFLSPSQITPSGSITTPERFVSVKAAMTTPILPEGATLIVCIGTIGKVGLLDKESAFNQQINALIPTAAIKQEFLYIWAKTLHSWLNKTSSAVVNAAIINKSRLCSAPCPLPPLDEQAEIVLRVKELLAFADAVEKKAQAATERVNKLTQSILAKAFRGELTADWRAANPNLISGENSAEALLEKIKAERECQKKQEKAKKNSRKSLKGKNMIKKIIKVADALKLAGKPLSGQQLLAEAGYPSDSDTDQLEQFFLDIREAMTIHGTIVKVERSDDDQDWFTLADSE